MRLSFLWFKARHRLPAQGSGQRPCRQDQRSQRPLSVLVAAGIFALLFNLKPARADAVAVAAVVEDNGARIVMTWPSPVGFEATAAGGHLQLRFERPIEADFGPLRRLSRWIGVATRTGDGRSVTFPLAAGVSVIGYTDGNTVIVDLFEKDKRPRTDAKNTAARDEPSSTAAAPPESQASTAGQALAERQSLAVRVRAADHSGYSRVVFDWPDDVGYRLEQHDDGAAIVFDRLARIDPSVANKRRLKFVQGLGVNTEGGQTTARLRLAAGAEVAVSRAGTKVVVDVRPAPKQAAAQQAAASPVVMPAAPPAATKLVTAPGQPAAKPGQDLRFAWEQGAAAALVRRGDAAWLIFDQPPPADLDPGRLRAAAGSAVDAIERVSHATATVLRLRLRPDRAPHLRADQGAWILDFVAAAPAPAQPIAVAVTHDEERRARLTFAVSEAAAPLAFTDEETGRTLVVVPVRTPGAGVAAERVLPELLVLATSQGIAIEPGTDSLRLRHSETGIELTSPNGLQVSAQPPSAEAAAADGGKRVAWYEPRVPVAGAAPSMRQRRLQLEHTAAQASGAAREQARLDLAALFLSEGMAAEAQGALTLIAETRPAVISDPDFRLMRGAAAVLLGRTDEAEADLAGTAVAATEEGRLWRAIAGASAGTLASADAVERVEPSLPLIEAYPKPLRFAAAKPLAEAALDHGRIEAAERLIGMLAAAAGTLHEQAWLPYLQGRLAAQQDRPAEALTLLAQAARSPSRGPAMRAQRALTRLRLERGEIDAAVAAKELQAVRANWRGDRFELEILRELAQLHFDAGAYAAGLRTLKEAALYLADLPEAATLNQEISEAFQGLFLSERAASVPPLTAVALFSDFRELVPSGPAGRQLAERLADRLTELDLLAEAVSVLERQDKETPAGVERARVGLKLAAAHTLNGNAEAALAALQRSAGAALPADLVQRRKRVEAEALIALGRDDDALPLLAGDAEADRVRADILRRRADWEGTAATLKRLVAPPANAELKADQSATVLELAATVALSDDREAMAGLRTDHGQALHATPAGAAFALITAEPTAPAMDAAALDAYVQEALAIRPLLSGKP